MNDAKKPVLKGPLYLPWQAQWNGYKECKGQRTNLANIVDARGVTIFWHIEEPFAAALVAAMGERDRLQELVREFEEQAAAFRKKCHDLWRPISSNDQALSARAIANAWGEAAEKLRTALKEPSDG